MAAQARSVTRIYVAICGEETDVRSHSGFFHRGSRRTPVHDRSCGGQLGGRPGWLHLENTRLAFLGFAATPSIISALAIWELGRQAAEESRPESTRTVQWPDRHRGVRGRAIYHLSIIVMAAGRFSPDELGGDLTDTRRRTNRADDTELGA